MRELNVMEIQEVSGAYKKGQGFFSVIGEAVKSASMGAIGAGFVGSIIGGKHGGDGGGLLGIGSIGQGVGMIYGGITGAIGGAIGGALLGWDATKNYIDQAMDGLTGGSFVP